MAKQPTKPPAKPAPKTPPISKAAAPTKQTAALEKTRAKPTGEKQKPMDATVKLAGKVEKGYLPTLPEAQKMAGRILDDQRNDPKPHRPVPKKP